MLVARAKAKTVKLVRADFLKCLDVNVGNSKTKILEKCIITL